MGRDSLDPDSSLEGAELVYCLSEGLPALKLPRRLPRIETNIAERAEPSRAEPNARLMPKCDQAAKARRQ